MKKHGFCSFIIALLLLSGCGFSRPETVKEEKEVVSETYEDVLVKARQIDADGNLYLAVTPQYLNEKGYEAGDLVQVTVNEQSFEMAILACPSDDVSDDNDLFLTALITILPCLLSQIDISLVYEENDLPAPGVFNTSP